MCKTFGRKQNIYFVSNLFETGFLLMFKRSNWVVEDFIHDENY